MKLKNLLNEDFVGSIKNAYGGAYREIFVNPSKSELLDLEEILEEIRFIADKEKKEVYVVNEDVLHVNLAKVAVGREGKYVINNFSGQAAVRRGIVYFREFSNEYLEYYEERGEKVVDLIEGIYNDIMGGEYDWLSRYYFDLNTVREIASNEVEYIIRHARDY